MRLIRRMQARKRVIVADLVAQVRRHLNEIPEDQWYADNPSPIYGYCICAHCKEWRANGMPDMAEDDEETWPPSTA